MRMNCEQFQNHLMDFMYGETPEKMPEGFYQHFEVCEKCSAILHDQRQAGDLVKDIPDISFSESVWKFPVHPVQKEKPARKHWYFRYLATAAMVMFIAVSTFMLLHSSVRYKDGGLTVRFGGEKYTGEQPLATAQGKLKFSLPEESTALLDRKNSQNIFAYSKDSFYPDVSNKELRELVQYVRQLENRYNIERDMLTDLIDNLATSTRSELYRRDQRVNSFINDYIRLAGTGSNILKVTRMPISRRSIEIFARIDPSIVKNINKMINETLIKVETMGIEPHKRNKDVSGTK